MKYPVYSLEPLNLYWHVSCIFMGILFKSHKFMENKNAFQWDAYHPLVDCIPACTAQGVSAQGRCLPRGVSTQGVSTQGVSTHGGSTHGVYVQGGVCPRCVYPSMQWGRRPLWTDRHL